MQSRYKQRHRKRRQNLFLNSLIAIVFVLILLVGANTFFGPSSQQTESTQEDRSTNDDPSLEASANLSNQGSAENNDNDQSPESESEEKNENESTEEENDESTDANDSYRFVGGGPDGPWEPIGTKQNGEHVSIYKKGTLDWKEKELAIAYGAGLLNEETIYWWIGNGGSPQRSIGRVSSKVNPDKIYVVTIEWVDGKGWKPIDVEVQE